MVVKFEFAKLIISSAFPGIENDGLFFSLLGMEARVPMSMQPAHWYHICLVRYDGTFKVKVDNKDVYTKTLPSSPPILLNGTLVIGQDQDIPGGRFNPIQSFVGKIVDLNFWTTKESIIFNEGQLCTKFGGPYDPLIPFENLPLVPHGAITTVMGHPCSLPNEVTIIWPTPMSYHESITLCNKFNFSIPKILNKSENDLLTPILAKASGMCFGFLSNLKYAWISNNLCHEDDLEQSIFAIRSPVYDNDCPDNDDGIVHRTMFISSGKWKLGTSNQKACALCLGSEFTSEYVLRGLCPEGEKMRMYPRRKAEHIYFHSHLDLLISRVDKDWKIQSHSKVTIAKLLGESDPFGSKEWIVFYEILNCQYQSSFTPMIQLDQINDKSTTLTLSTCYDHEYICGNGTCLPSDARCSHIEECNDGGDEHNCHLIKVPDGYSHNISPPLIPLNLAINLTLEKVII